jgi:hypothetical protein
LIHVENNKWAQDELFRQLEKLKFDPPRRFRLARKLAREVKKYSGHRADRQQSLAGGSFAPRSNRRSRWRKNSKDQWRKKRKMLLSLGKVKNMAEYRDGEAVVVSWKKKGATGGWAGIAYGHQHGLTQEHKQTSGQRAAVYKWHVKLRGKPASRKMAEALIRNGYRLPVKGKGGKIKLRKVNAGYIRKNMSQLRAAWILRLLVRQDVSKASPRNPKPQQWKIKLPARSFLGAIPAETEKLLNLLGQQILNDVKN